MGHEGIHMAHSAHKLYEQVELFGDGPKAKEVSDIIKQHALAATGAGFIPVPGLDIAALAANTWTMYVRINKAVGVSFSENAMKSIASGIIANIATLLPAAALGAVVGSFMKFVPGIGTVGGIAVSAVANVALLYVSGKVYLKSLQMVLHSDQPLTEGSLRGAARDVARDKAFVQAAYEEGKETAKNR